MVSVSVIHPLKANSICIYVSGGECKGGRLCLRGISSFHAVRTSSLKNSDVL